MHRFKACVCAMGLLGIASGQTKKAPPAATPPVSIGPAVSVTKLEPVILTRASLDEKVITLRLTPAGSDVDPNAGTRQFGCGGGSGKLSG